MEIGAILADDQKSYFIFGRQEKCLFLIKTTVQCTDELYHEI